MKKILIVDDNQDTVATLRLVLERAGYQVETAGNGQEGFQKALACLPDAILLDIMMPIMDGCTMNEELQRHPAAREIPVIIISARSGMAPLFTGPESAGIKGYLVKPFRAEDLLMKLREIFDGGRA